MTTATTRSFTALFLVVLTINFAGCMGQGSPIMLASAFETEAGSDEPPPVYTYSGYIESSDIDNGTVDEGGFVSMRLLQCNDDEVCVGFHMDGMFTIFDSQIVTEMDERTTVAIRANEINYNFLMNVEEMEFTGPLAGATEIDVRVTGWMYQEAVFLSIALTVTNNSGASPEISLGSFDLERS